MILLFKTIWSIIYITGYNSEGYDLWGIRSYIAPQVWATLQALMLLMYYLLYVACLRDYHQSVITLVETHTSVKFQERRRLIMNNKIADLLFCLMKHLLWNNYAKVNETLQEAPLHDSLQKYNNALRLTNSIYNKMVNFLFRLKEHLPWNAQSIFNETLQ